MSRKIMSILLTLALLISCVPATFVLANDADLINVDINFEDVADFEEFTLKPEVMKSNTTTASNGDMNIVNIPDRGNVLVSRFSDKFNSDEENNTVQFYVNPAVSLVSNKVVMEAKVYPTKQGNHAIRLFEHTWSSGNQATDALVVFQNGMICGGFEELVSYSLNQWYHIFVVVNSTADPSERTFDLYVNGECVGSGLKREKCFINENGNSISYINIGHRAWADGFCYIDDVKVYEYPGLKIEGGNIENYQQSVNPATKEINLNFTAPLNSATIGGIKLKDSDGNEVNIIPETDSLDKSVLNIKINEDLKSWESYTLSFDGVSGIIGGNYGDTIYFKTCAPMMNMTSVPKDGAKDVGVWDDIVLSFDAPINSITFDKSKIEISGLTQDDFKAELTGANEITVSLHRPLYDAMEYTLTLSDTLLSTKATGSKKVFNKSFSFTTEVSDKFTDEFDNYVRKMHDYSKKVDSTEPNFTFNSEANNNVDSNVLTVAYNPAPAYMVYYIEEGVHSFRLDKHVGNSQRPDKDAPVEIYVASEYDGIENDENWHNVTPVEKLIEVPGLQDFLSAYKYEMISGVPDGAKYLIVKICEPAVPPVAEDGRVNIWSPELSRLEINHVPAFKLATVNPPVIEEGDWINLDFTNAVGDISFEDAIAVTDKSGNTCDIKYAVSDNFGKRVKLKIAGGLDEQSEYTVTIDPNKLIGAAGAEFSGNNVVVFRTGIKNFRFRAEFFSGTDTTKPSLENMTDGTITVKGTVLSKESNAQVVIARYDINGVFMDIKAPAQFTSGDTASTFEETLTGCDKTDTIKVFCFDSLDTVGFLGEYEVLEPAE